MIKEVNSAEFKEVYGSGVVLADFYSKTCGPCKMLSFVLQDVDKALGDQVTILKIDFDANKDLTDEYSVAGYPTMVLLKDGEEKKRFQGLQQKPAIIKALEELI